MFFLIVLCVTVSSLQNIFKKQYSLKTSGGAFTFSAMLSFFAMLFFVVAGRGFSACSGLFVYCLAFALAYAAATVTCIWAIACGSLAITSLIVSYSLIIPTLYGLAVLGDRATVFTYTGLAALMISLFLVREKSSEKTKMSRKWIICVIICFFTNGICSVVQKMQQTAFNGAYKNEFMIIALAIVTLMFIIPAVIFERKEFAESLKFGVVPSFLCGVCNGATNLLVMVILGVVATSVFFPIISAGGVITSFAFSVLLYKEKLLPRRLCGIAFGIAALVFLNL